MHKALVFGVGNICVYSSDALPGVLMQATNIKRQQIEVGTVRRGVVRGRAVSCGWCGIVSGRWRKLTCCVVV